MFLIFRTLAATVFTNLISIFQWSRVVAVIVIVQMSYIVANEIQTLPEEELKTLSNIFKKMNKDFNPDNTVLDLDPSVDIMAKEAMKSEQNRTINENVFKGNDTKRIQRRSESNVPWHCNTQIFWRDLGSLHYPRFVKEILCSGGSCYHGFYSCRPVSYTVRVLTARENEDGFEIALPRSLRDDWRFMDLEISVACQCKN